MCSPRIIPIRLIFLMKSGVCIFSLSVVYYNTHIIDGVFCVNGVYSSVKLCIIHKNNICIHDIIGLVNRVTYTQSVNSNSNET